MKDLGQPQDYLGWTIRRSPDGSIHAAQPDLVARALDHAGLTDANPRHTTLPKNSNVENSPDARPLYETETLTFASLLGYMRYLTACTRLYIAF